MQVLLNIFIAYRIRSENSKFDQSVFDGDIIEEKLSGFTGTDEFARSQNEFLKLEIQFRRM